MKITPLLLGTSLAANATTDVKIGGEYGHFFWSAAALNVFDVTGRTVLEQTLAAGRTGTASLDLRKLEAGVYLVKVATKGFSATHKLVAGH